MHRLPTRCRLGQWEVFVPHGSDGDWIRCGSLSIARTLSESGNLAYHAIERRRTGEEIAAELEAAAELFRQFNCPERAAWLLEHAKFARGEPSIFDDSSAA
jgi:hypothetical protein